MWLISVSWPAGIPTDKPSDSHSFLKQQLVTELKEKQPKQQFLWEGLRCKYYLILKDFNN